MSNDDADQRFIIAMRKFLSQMERFPELEETCAKQSARIKSLEAKIARMKKEAETD